MTYTPDWTQSDASGNLLAAEHLPAETDLDELHQAVNRRRALTYQATMSLSLPTWIATEPISTLRSELTALTDTPVGGLGGTPASPESMTWLWDQDDADQGKVIVHGTPGSGEVDLLTKLTGSAGWTDASLNGSSMVRAVHVNELRRAVEALRRGEWTLPYYFTAGLFSQLPDTAWIGQTVANNGSDEVRSVGYAALRAPSALGLSNVAVRTDSRIEVTPDTACRLGLYRCKRTIDFVNDPPTWNHYAPSTPSAWAMPGGTGSTDADLLGEISTTANSAAVFTGSAVASALQAMVDGQPQNLLIRRSDTGTETIGLSARAVVAFVLDSPPN